MPTRGLRAFVSVKDVLARLAPSSASSRVRIRWVASRQWFDELVRFPPVWVEIRPPSGDRIPLGLTEEAWSLEVGPASIEAIQPEVALVCEWARRAGDRKARTWHFDNIVARRCDRFYGTEVLRNPHQTRYPGRAIRAEEGETPKSNGAAGTGAQPEDRDHPDAGAEGQSDEEPDPHGDPVPDDHEGRREQDDPDDDQRNRGEPAALHAGSLGHAIGLRALSTPHPANRAALRSATGSEHRCAMWRRRVVGSAGGTSMRWLAVWLLVVAFAGCGAPATPSPSPGGKPMLGVSNGTSLDVTLVVNGVSVGVYPAGGPEPSLDPGALPPLPCTQNHRCCS